MLDITFSFPSLFNKVNIWVCSSFDGLSMWAASRKVSQQPAMLAAIKYVEYSRVRLRHKSYTTVTESNHVRKKQQTNILATITHVLVWMSRSGVLNDWKNVSPCILSKIFSLSKLHILLPSEVFIGLKQVSANRYETVPYSWCFCRLILRPKFKSLNNLPSAACMTTSSSSCSSLS